MGIKSSLWLKISSLTVILVTLISFWGIHKIFFQQDEWLGLGGAIYRQETYGNLGSIGQVFNFKKQSEGIRFLPITSIASQVFYTNYGLNMSSYAITMLILILASVLLLNLVVYKLTNSYLLSTLVAILWVTNNLSYQAFSWIGTFVSSLGSIFFFILSLYLLLLYGEKRKPYLFILSLVTVTASLLTKESSVFYPVVYVLIVWIFFKGFKFLEKIKLTLITLIPLLISLVLPRIVYYFNGRSDFAPPVHGANYHELLYNFFLLPAKTLFLIFFSNERLYAWVYKANTVFFGTQTDGFVIERIIGDAVTLMVSFYILLVVAFALAFATMTSKKIIIFSLLSLFASVLPLIFFKSGSVIVEQRYYVYPAIFASLLLVSVVNSFLEKLKFLRPVLIMLIFIPIIIFNVKGVKKMLKTDVEIGTYRSNIIRTVAAVEPRLGDTNIFYFYTGHTGFYEFQSGFGQTLAVMFYKTGKIPKEILTDRDYWDLSYEGIKRYDGKTFGYFMTYDRLVKALKDSPEISLDQVHAYYWDYQKHTVENVSADIREKLGKGVANEKIPQ